MEKRSLPQQSHQMCKVCTDAHACGSYINMLAGLQPHEHFCTHVLRTWFSEHVYMLRTASDSQLGKLASNEPQGFMYLSYFAKDPKLYISLVIPFSRSIPQSMRLASARTHRVCLGFSGIMIRTFIRICMYAVYIYICQYLYVMHVCMCICVCMHACMDVCMYACTYVRMQACRYVRMYVCMYAHVYAYLCVCM